MNSPKFVYYFGSERTDGDREMKDLLGGKGANLAEMTRIGLPVPPGFTITTEACEEFNRLDGEWPEGLEEEISSNLSLLEKETGRGFGDRENPLLVSVRSGAAISMPGMMDTVLNLGLNRDTIKGLATKTGNERLAWDSFRRFMQMFGDVVMKIPSERFENILEAVKKEKDVEYDKDLSAQDLQEVVDRYKKLYEGEIGDPFPSDPWDQLRLSINAVFGSWSNPRAIRYRELNEITDLLGTAVNVQTMVFGNMGENSGTGVCFTRDPATGKNDLYGEYLMDAQGEDVVAGIRTPQPISTLSEINQEVYEELQETRKILEQHYRDMQDLEFTIMEGKLYILQTRTGKRTVFAALNMAVDMVEEGLIDIKTALMRIPAPSFNQLFAPVLDQGGKESARYLTKGLNASPGGACGMAAFTAERAEEMAGEGKAVILCRKETSPEDIGGMAAAKGVLTARGGMTSHAAVVARGMGAPCVAGAGELEIKSDEGYLKCGEVKIEEGDVIAIDGFTGEVFAGEVRVRPSEIVQVLRGEMSSEDSMLFDKYSKVVGWADDVRRLGVRTNADTPRDTEMAVLFGAEGIGLCRTEHMFFEGDRINSFRKMILVAEEVKRLKGLIESGNGEEELRKKLEGPMSTYREALDELLPLQREDFEGIFRVLEGRPCTIRLLDPPLHEFLPKGSEGQRELADLMGVSVENVARTVDSLNEFNPMMGHRGCRLGLTYPEVSDMQVRAVVEAAVECKKDGVEVKPEIMIPLVGHRMELSIARERALKVAHQVLEEKGLSRVDLPLNVGTMIEVPRAALTADEVAEEADFFSFGTNDLTQMGCGFSRDDSGGFLQDYIDMGIYERDPFASIDAGGVGKLVEMAVDLGRKTKPALKIGVCGEHGGEPLSVRFFNRAGLDYVSCSPFRVPVARLAAAQAILEES
ncbi:pyruvate, phosphate dikinase [Candidatus Fermentibacteria bacterium]|nr:pyruvate, phosphate dikinase [Candidatus Fermentibacteria bacterium]